jgi:ubiquinone/menaquinone biosynthesis C-methylase UbiE
MVEAQSTPAPHPMLTAYYKTAAGRDVFVRRLFDQSAASYDRINAAFSFGSGAWYRRRALAKAGLRPGAFAEYKRALRPGGRVLLLEITRPESRLAYAATRFYLGRIVPAISACLGGGVEARTLMQYYWDTIDTCVPPATILEGLRQAGFEDVECDVQFGIFRAYMARRPECDGA